MPKVATGVSVGKLSFSNTGGTTVSSNTLSAYLLGFTFRRMGSERYIYFYFISRHYIMSPDDCQLYSALTLTKAPVRI